MVFIRSYTFRKVFYYKAYNCCGVGARLVQPANLHRFTIH